ncbi:MAG: ABC transporter ATP-binding protein [Trueperella sp.]|nr:ABC transporter ATP-binding protein [Trueperella sp.]
MITVENLTKDYGSTRAVDDLSFSLRTGAVTGFLGPNGSGKSTTMRCILGLDNPTKGRATIDGVEYRKLKSPLTKVGALLDSKAFHPKRTARRHLQITAATHGIPKSRVDELIEMTGLTSVANKKLGSFSLGMGQRLGIAQALLGDPEVLLFDEPVNGLDPDGVRWVRTMMRQLAAEGRTVFVSSHLMSEMALTADDLVILGRGKLIASGPVSEFTEAIERTRIRVAGPDMYAIDAAVRTQGWIPEPHPAAEKYPAGYLELAGTTRAEVGHVLHQSGLEIHELSESHSSLEDVFMDLTESEVEFGSGLQGGSHAN